MVGAPASQPFRVLVVCTANHCRSPMAEHLLRHQLSQRNVDWSVASAGTHARPGLPMHRSAARLLARRGIDTSGWLSTRLSRDVIEESSLILTAGEEQRGLVALQSPSALGRTFPLLQFAHLAASAPQGQQISGPDVGPELLVKVLRARGRVQPMPRDQRELPDPMNGSALKFRACARTIERAVQQVLDAATG